MSPPLLPVLYQMTPTAAMTWAASRSCKTLSTRIYKHPAIFSFRFDCVSIWLYVAFKLFCPGILSRVLRVFWLSFAICCQSQHAPVSARQGARATQDEINT